MNWHKYFALFLCISLVLSVSATRGLASASCAAGDDAAPVRLVATAFAGPIGTASAASMGAGSLFVNGRSLQGETKIWSGDLLEYRGSANFPVSLDSIGQVSLSRDSAVRLATADEHGVLVAALLRGSMKLRLEQNARAYVTAAGTTFVSTLGARFVASVSTGQPEISVTQGQVKVGSQQPQQYVIRSAGHGPNLKVASGSLIQIRVQVLEDDAPVPGVGVTFTLDTPGVGKFGVGTLAGNSYTVTTDYNGVATAPFSGLSRGTTAVSATVEGTRTSWTGQVTVTSSASVSKGTGWTIFAIAGAAAAAGIAYAVTRDKDPVQAQPPVVKLP